MKIFFASQSFYPNIGGVSTYLLNLANELVKKGNEVVEVHLRPSGEVHEDKIKGIEIHRVPREPIHKEIMSGYSKFKETIYKGCHDNLKDFRKNPHEMEGYKEYNKVNEYFGEQLRELLEQHSADIVHIHDFQLLFAYKYVPRGIPCILTWHIPFIDNMSNPLSTFLIEHMKEYDKIVFSSPDYIKAAVRAGLPADKAELIYPIANTNLFRKMEIDKSEVKKSYNIPETAKVILCVQRVDPKSGHEQLIRAMPKILKKIPDAKLVFVGGESLSNKLSNSRALLKQKQLELISSLRLEDNIIWTGNIDYFKLPELYNSADLVTLCSKNEGFGLAVTEGMACANPVVGTKVGGIRLQVKDEVNGFLVNVGDIDSTADSIIKVLDNKNLCKEMSEQSLKMIEESFRLDIAIEKHLMLYNNTKKLKDDFYKIEYLDLSNIKAIITDLDRTITQGPAKSHFDPEDYDEGLLKEMKSLGKDLFLATGRNIYYVMKLIRHFKKVWRCVIAENGAVLYFTNTDKTMTINTTYASQAKEIIKSMGLPGCTTGKVIASIRKEDEKKVRSRLGRIAGKVAFIPNINEIMILPKGVDKGVGLRLAMQYLNIDLENSIVVGDGENDVDMFLNPGFKIALANARPKLKRLANQVTESPSTKGIREIIAKLQKE